MQANLFKLLAIAAAFSAVHSAPVETAEVTKAQINGTQTNDSYKVAGVDLTCSKTGLLHISKRGKEGDIFERAICRNYGCWEDGQCKSIGCSECVLYFNMCGDSWTACR